MKQLNNYINEALIKKHVNSIYGDVVDLGLGSGTLWCKYNLGATTPEDHGGYYAWGETKEKLRYSPDTYKYQHNDKYNYEDNLEFLDKEDDAAYVNSNGKYRMPTFFQINELIKTTNITWTTYNGVPGAQFTSRKDESQFIFIPAAGLFIDANTSFDDTYAIISSSQRPKRAETNNYLLQCGKYGSEVSCRIKDDNRDLGLNIRPVLNKGNIIQR